MDRTDEQREPNERASGLRIRSLANFSREGTHMLRGELAGYSSGHVIFVRCIRVGGASRGRNAGPLG